MILTKLNCVGQECRVHIDSAYNGRYHNIYVMMINDRWCPFNNCTHCCAKFRPSSKIVNNHLKSNRYCSRFLTPQYLNWWNQNSWKSIIPPHFTSLQFPLLDINREWFWFLKLSPKVVQKKNFYTHFRMHTRYYSCLFLDSFAISMKELSIFWIKPKFYKNIIVIFFVSNQFVV